MMICGGGVLCVVMCRLLAFPSSCTIFWTQTKPRFCKQEQHVFIFVYNEYFLLIFETEMLIFLQRIQWLKQGPHYSWIKCVLYKTAPQWNNFVILVKTTKTVREYKHPPGCGPVPTPVLPRARPRTWAWRPPSPPAPRRPGTWSSPPSCRSLWFLTDVSSQRRSSITEWTYLGEWSR